jgi:FkbM family methyltransferase
MSQLNLSPEQKEIINQHDHNINILTQQMAELICEPSDTIIDVGFNCLQNTKKFMEIVGTHGCVVGFEPIKFWTEQARYWAADHHYNFQAFEIALSNYVGTSEFYHYTDPDGYSGLRPTTDLPYTSYDVAVDMLDSFDHELQRVAFVKIDIEGGELHALQGAVKILQKHQPVIVAEIAWAEAYGSTDQEFRSWMAQQNYVYIPCALIDFHIFVHCNNTEQINKVTTALRQI